MFFDIISIALVGIIMTAISVYMWHIMLDKDLDFKCFKTYLFLILMPFVIQFNYLYVTNYFKAVSITFIFIIFCKFLFNVSLSKAIIAPIVSQLCLFISEVIFALVFLAIININEYNAFDNYGGTLLPNTMISLMTFCIIKTGLVKRIYMWLLKATNKIKKYELLIFIAILIVTINLIQVNIYYKVSLKSLILINICLTLIYAFIIMRLANTKNNYLIVSSKYNTSVNCLKEYESIVNKYRIDNHENKNQLRTIKGKVDPDNKKVINYIDRVLNTRIKDNDKLLNSVNVIPEGGLRGLIYSKVLVMEEKKIKYNLHVDETINVADMIELGDELIDDICKIVGVYLDNAIEAVENLNLREIQLNISKVEDSMDISILNNYEGVLDMDKINDIGYTTKPYGRGYGLSLVTKILSSSYKLSNKTYIDDRSFKQVLKIKM